MNKNITGERLNGLLERTDGVILHDDSDALYGPQISMRKGITEMRIEDSEIEIHCTWTPDAVFTISEAGEITIPVSDSYGIDLPRGSIRITLLQTMSIDPPAIMLTIEGGVVQNITSNTDNISVVIVSFDDQDEFEPVMVTGWNDDVDVISGAFSDHIEQSLTDMPDETQSLTINELRKLGL